MPSKNFGWRLADIVENAAAIASYIEGPRQAPKLAEDCQNAINASERRLRRYLVTRPNAI